MNANTDIKSAGPGLGMGLRLLTFILCLTAVGVSGCKKKLAIDTTSMQSLRHSLVEAQKTESREDIAIVTQIIKGAVAGLDLKDPGSEKLALERVRARLQGKSFSAVVAEAKAANSQIQHRADDFVRERQKKWSQRAGSINTIEAGLTRDKIIELLGEPDTKADSPTTENWLYKYDAGHDREQMWIDAIIVQLTNGVVSSVLPAPTRMGIAEMLETAK